MNPAQFLSHFDRFSEAPDAIPRLRRFILDLAVRGRLVGQGHSEEPASELLKRIQAEKARLVKKGIIRRENPQAEIKTDEIPFALPDYWAWTRLGDLIHLVSGQHLQPTEYSGQKQSGPPYITGPADFGQNGLVITRYAVVRKAIANKGQILLTVKGAGVGKTAICDLPEVAISRQLMAMTAIEWCQQFLLLVTHRLAETLKESARSLIPGISREDVEQFIFPIPPLAEQQRIVTKVDELMALCDRLEAAQALREKQRDRLAASSLSRLNNGADPDAFRNHARFTLDNLPRLTTRLEHIQQLRQTILNLAVRGKLVPQDHHDESAFELLRRIEAEKVRQLKSGKLKQQKPLADADIIEAPFEIPNSWCWSRIDDCFAVGGGIQKTPARTPKDNPYSYIGVANVYRGRLDLSEVKKFELLEGDLERFRLVKGDILVVEGNGSPNEIGRCAVWSGEITECVHQNHIIRCRPFILGLTPFALRFLNSPNGTEIMKMLAITSSGLYSLSVGKIRTIVIPIPPLTEQHRIVAKVDELMALCDRLEAQFTTAQTESRRLLEAVLHEALTGAAGETKECHDIRDASTVLGTGFL